MSYTKYANTAKQQSLAEYLDEGKTPYLWAKDNNEIYESAKIMAKKLKARAAHHGYAPDQGFAPTTCPPGFVLDKSTVHAKDGVTVQRWDRVSADKEAARQAVIDAISEACKELKQAPRVALNAHTSENLLTLYTITDFHLGMYAWAKESGESWNVDIAEQALWNAIESMCQGSPNSDMAVLCNLGDFLHWDGLLAVTPAHKNVLDADTRYDKLAGMSLRVMSGMVSRLLEKHQHVHVICAEGNHDEAGSIWIRQCIAAMHDNNDRVTVDTSPFPFYAVQHGTVMLGFHHGHKVKERQLRDVFCSDHRFRAVWGESQYAYIHTGHLHCQAKFEDGGAIIERHPTLSARDAYAARHGYCSHRCAHAITYHKAKGEVGRVTAYPDVEDV